MVAVAPRAMSTTGFAYAPATKTFVNDANFISNSQILSKKFLFASYLTLSLLEVGR
ncbi:hypothetical protein [Nostoc sp.]|uniref:hypothetical protein n=1 Tax=Nostoc sp. TaxID=1180 RepID=UPI002FF57FC1